MSSESLRESISALMDGEAEQLEVRRVLHASEQDPDVRRSWERYQLARSVMHKEPWNTGIDLSAGIAAALADEPQLAVKARTSSRWKTHLGRVAVAASVTVAVLVGVRMVNHDPAVTSQMASVEHGVPATSAPVSAAPAIAPVGAGAVLAGFSSHADQKPQPTEQMSEPSDWQEQRMGTYLRRHAENNAQSAPQLVPYARAASLENN
ncbi:sigma-E factor negative regulatory protein [Halopseudomonas sp. Lyrl_26]|uniref:sigma-E factor negative regulatory protein n=1 Tax=Halopseudomonas sp. Lyrl_26 TaxID=3110923 RepID=UPI003F7D73E1